MCRRNLVLKLKIIKIVKIIKICQLSARTGGNLCSISTTLCIFNVILPSSVDVRIYEC